MSPAESGNGDALFASCNHGEWSNESEYCVRRRTVCSLSISRFGSVASKLKGCIRWGRWDESPFDEGMEEGGWSQSEPVIWRGGNARNAGGGASSQSGRLPFDGAVMRVLTRNSGLV